jgi:hypothetical protein
MGETNQGTGKASICPCVCVCMDGCVWWGDKRPPSSARWTDLLLIFFLLLVLILWKGHNILDSPCRGWCKRWGSSHVRTRNSGPEDSPSGEGMTRTKYEYAGLVRHDLAGMCIHLSGSLEGGN